MSLPDIQHYLPCKLQISVFIRFKKIDGIHIIAIGCINTEFTVVTIPLAECKWYFLILCEINYFEVYRFSRERNKSNQSVLGCSYAYVPENYLIVIWAFESIHC